MLNPESSEYFLIKFLINFLESSFWDLLLFCLVPSIWVYGKMYQAIILLKEKKHSDVEDYFFAEISDSGERIINCREMF
jgi:hypothetical protein